MKKVKLFLLITITLMLSCNEVTEKFINSKIEIGEGIPTKTLANSSEEITDYSITCSGTCDDGNYCGLSFTNSPEGEMEILCRCEDCVMQIAFDNPTTEEQKQMIFNNFSTKYLFLTELDNYMEEYYSGLIYNILSIEVSELGNSYSILYFIETENNEEISIMYANYFVGDSDYDNRFQIDCNGSCDDPNKTCREKFNLVTGEAECTCEGSCKMTVTDLGPGPDLKPTQN